MENDNHIYPAEIMPRDDFAIRLDITAIHEECGIGYVQRRRGDYSSETGGYPNNITPRTFGVNLAGMSVNLMGGKFTPVHVCFEPKDVVDLNETSTLISADAVKYDYCGENEGVYIDTQIHEEIFPSTREFNKEGEMQKVKNALVNTFAEFVKHQQYSVQYQIKLRHVPTLQNYWHWQIEVHPLMYEDEVVKKESSAWQKNLFRAFVNYLIPFATLSVPNFPSIPEKVYLRS